MASVFTGTGYHELPVFGLDQVGMVDDPTFRDDGTNLQWDYQTQSFVPRQRLIYGAFGDNNDTNWMPLGGDANSFSYMLKSGDKEGTIVDYARQGDQYVPTIRGTQAWDTNEGKGNLGLGIAAGMIGGFAAAPYLMPGATAAPAAPGTMTTYGVLDTSMALPGTTITPASLTAPGTMTTYGVLDKSMALPGTKFVEGVAPSLLSQVGNTLLKNPSLLNSLGTLAGGALGKATEGDGGSGGSGGYNPVTAPQMWGGAKPPTFNTYGPTQTERYMRNEYLPSLFSGAQQSTQGLLGPLGSYGDAVRRGLLDAPTTAGLAGAPLDAQAPRRRLFGGAY
jgi:hypothetical protein